MRKLHKALMFFKFAFILLLMIGWSCGKRPTENENPPDDQLKEVTVNKQLEVQPEDSGVTIKVTKTKPGPGSPGNMAHCPKGQRCQFWIDIRNNSGQDLLICPRKVDRMRDRTAGELTVADHGQHLTLFGGGCGTIENGRHIPSLVYGNPAGQDEDILVVRLVFQDKGKNRVLETFRPPTAIADFPLCLRVGAGEGKSC